MLGEGWRRQVLGPLVAGDLALGRQHETLDAGEEDRENDDEKTDESAHPGQHHTVRARVRGYAIKRSVKTVT